MVYRFVIFQGDNGQWYWHLIAPNNERIAASGEGYVRREDAEQGILTVQTHAAEAAVEQ